MKYVLIETKFFLDSFDKDTVTIATMVPGPDGEDIKRAFVFDDKSFSDLSILLDTKTTIGDYEYFLGEWTLEKLITLNPMFLNVIRHDIYNKLGRLALMSDISTLKSPAIDLLVKVESGNEGIFSTFDTAQDNDYLSLGGFLISYCLKNGICPTKDIFYGSLNSTDLTVIYSVFQSVPEQKPLEELTDDYVSELFWTIKLLVPALVLSKDLESLKDGTEVWCQLMSAMLRIIAASSMDEETRIKIKMALFSQTVYVISSLSNDLEPILSDGIFPDEVYSVTEHLLTTAHGLLAGSDTTVPKAVAKLQGCTPELLINIGKMIDSVELEKEFIDEADELSKVHLEERELMKAVSVANG